MPVSEHGGAQDGLTPYGFDWGPIEVVRLAHVEGRGYALEIKTRHASMQVYVSEKGRVIEPMEVRRNAGYQA